MSKVNLAELKKIHAQAERHGIGYGLGAKAPALSSSAESIDRIDCSGYVRWLLFQASNGTLKIPDGSQNQRAWAEQNLRQVDKYADAARYMTGTRLFIAFIKPFTNGCGKVGHVWLLADGDPGAGVDAETIESCSARGVCSRRWNTGTLMREVYSVFEVPTE